MFGTAGVGGVNLYSIVVAVAGAVLFLVVYHAIRRGVVGAGFCRSTGLAGAAASSVA
jgi:Transglycosylase associated protein